MALLRQSSSLPLALQIRSAYRDLGFDCTSVGNGSLGALIGGKANARERPLVSLCRDTLPKPSQMRLPLYGHADLLGLRWALVRRDSCRI